MTNNPPRIMCENGEHCPSCSTCARHTINGYDDGSMVGASLFVPGMDKCEMYQDETP